MLSTRSLATPGPGPRRRTGKVFMDPALCNFETAPSDLIGVDPRLGPLADNGGPTLTHLLGTGSPAVNAGPAAGAASDQRGAPRRRPDIGAYERRTCAGALVNVVGTNAADKLRGTAGRDGILGLGGRDAIRARAGNAVCAGAGRDRVVGGAGRNKLKGEAGNDLLIGGGGRDLCAGGPGRDRPRLLRAHEARALNRLRAASHRRPTGRLRTGEDGPRVARPADE